MISVCMATHNGETYLKKQIDSILEQIGPDDEIVVSDDGSTDDTLEVLGGYHDSRIKVFYFTQPTKTNHLHECVCRNFENALIHAKGDYIFLSDQDDIWLPNKIKICVEDLQKSDLVLHDFMYIDSYDKVIKALHYNGNFRPKNILLRRGKHFGCAMAFRRSVLEYALPFPKNLLLHDYWIGILSELLGSFYFEKTPLIKYRIHHDNTSHTSNTILFKIKYRVVNMINIFKRVYLFRREMTF